MAGLYWLSHGVAEGKSLNLSNLNPIYEREFTKLDVQQGEGRWNVSKDREGRRGCEAFLLHTLSVILVCALCTGASLRPIVKREEEEEEEMSPRGGFTGSSCASSTSLPTGAHREVLCRHGGS